MLSSNINSSSVALVSSGTYHKSIQTSHSSGIMLALWELPTVLNMLEDIPHQCPIVKDLIMDVLLGWLLKGVALLHLTLWLLRDVCCTDRSYLPQLMRQ